MTETFVRLTDEARSEMAKTMAHTWTRVEELRAKKARDSKKTQDDIDEELENIGRLCRLINDDGQPRDQMDLFADAGRVTEDAARQALAAVMARQPECSAVDDLHCDIHGDCSCDLALAEGEDREPGKAPAVEPACVLHGVNMPHITDPPAVELTEPQIIEKMAREAVEEWARLGKTPESRVEVNTAVKLAIAATSMPVKRRKPFRQAVDRLLGDESVPANHGASETLAEEPGDDAGNVAEAEA